MIWMRRVLCTVTLGLVLAAAAGCGHGAAGGTSGAGPPPAIHGTVSSFLAASKAHLTPMAGVRVAAYRRAFPIVPLMADPPPAAASTVTAHDGTFSLRTLPAGRYFVVADQTAKWVTVSSGHGAVADFRVCADCPKPM